MAKKVTALDFDGDEIPEKYNNKNYEVRRDSMSQRIIRKTTGEQVAMKCPEINKWCDGTMDKVFTCVGCEHFDNWLSKRKFDTKPFKKADDGKLQWSLMPFEQLEDVVRVLMNGAKKYACDNWKKCDDVNRYKDALMRHVVSYIKGEKNDPEDNLSHLAHAMCNCLFLMYFDKRENKTLLEQFDELKRGDK